jgi:hypothetical protein
MLQYTLQDHPSLTYSSHSNMSKTPVYSDRAPKPRPIYNQAIVANGFVFCSGQLPKNLDGQIVRGTVQDRTVSSLPLLLPLFVFVFVFVCLYKCPPYVLSTETKIMSVCSVNASEISRSF